MLKSKLKPVSKKRHEQLAEYAILVGKLRRLCDNRSEFSGQKPTWESNYLIEPHHIDGRNGKRLLNPFGIIMLTRNEHDKIWEYSKETLLQMIRPLRIKQGFKEG